MKSSNYKFGVPYKIKHLGVYSSFDILIDKGRKYRKVFDKSEISYLGFDFVFYNKQFDEQNWSAKINIKVFKETKEIYDFNKELEIRKSQNEIMVSSSWGTENKGIYWEQGEYLVHAYIDDILSGSENFFVEDVGLVSPDNNPYFDVEFAKIYEGDDNGWKQDSKKYLSVFEKSKTRYVWLDFKFKNKLERNWQCELFLNFYSDTGELIGRIVDNFMVENNQKNKIIKREHGLGNNKGDIWVGESYTLEVVFMDTLIAVIPFNIGEKDEISTEENFIPKTKVTTNNEIILDPNAKEKLFGLIGLEEVKKQITEHLKYLEFVKLRKEKGIELENKMVLHSVYTGNPGTGKTTVVKLLGQIYQQMGLLSKGQVHEVGRADLIGKYIGETAPKVKEQIEKARGGILFIDEAYALARSDKNKTDYGLEAIEILIKEMSDGIGDLAIIFAGYPNEMNTLLNVNPGLKSRLKYNLHFDDYTPDELIKIAEYSAKKSFVKLENEAKTHLYKLLLDAYRDRDKTFGNARFANALIDEAKINLGLRLTSLPNFKELSNDVLSTITYDDVKNLHINEKNIEEISIPIDEPLLKITIAELNQLVGLDNVKNSINETIKLSRYYKEIGNNALNKMAKHTVFVGNPGTGKTTIARIYSKIYKALGLLDKGHLVEVSREDLVAGYVGQTAIKTKEKLDEAMGGVLFIDEAYTLTNDTQDSYGKEAIEVILKTMEDRRGDFVIIAAGYPNNMQMFLKSNPGLKSRFDRNLHFHDYNVDDLYNIAIKMLHNNNLKMNDEASNFVKNNIEIAYENRDEYFGNARYVRKIIDDIVQKHNLRMASIPKSMRTDQDIQTVNLDDVKNITLINKNFNDRQKLGFIK